MKILFIGNQGNTGFRFTFWLRQKGIDASLLIPKQLKNKRSLPENDMPSIKDNYPEWIIQYKEKIFPYLYPSSSLRRLSRNYDLILTTGDYILPVLLLKKPIGFFPVGSDLTQFPFQSNPLINEIYSYLYRRRINNVSRIFTVQSDCIWSARILGQGNKIDLFPFLVDTKNIKNNINYGLLEKLKMKYGKYDLVFFNPTRKNMDKGKVDYKGSEKILNAFKKFQEKTKKNVKMIAGLHGEHAEMFEKMVDSCNLKEYVDYTGHLSLPELHAYMSMDNVVTFDQFTINLNTLGGIQREALALGSIIISSTDVHTKEFKESYGDGCPLLTAFSEEQILMQMEKLAGMTKDKLNRMSYNAVEWADKYIHWESRIDELIVKLEELKSQL